jgi:hypothetical protein
MHIDSTPYTNMTNGTHESYANFRFYSEVLLSDMLPRSLEASFLELHNNKGGRLAGANRFLNRLDDMPTAGWGYGAITNNQTEDFLALLYGHMATYQSRGTFHTTEQLQYRGEGYYRSFSSWDDPMPDVVNVKPAETAETTAGGDTGDKVEAGGEWAVRSDGRSRESVSLPGRGRHGAGDATGLGYYINENDVSFCVVSQILVARLTRWQLVFEDYYRGFSDESNPPSIWLGRAAPKRWFAFSKTAAAAAAVAAEHSAAKHSAAEHSTAAMAPSVVVANAPTDEGRVSFNITVTAEGAASYSVVVEDRAASDAIAATAASTGTNSVVWKLRWPGKVSSVRVSGCTIVGVSAADGIVAVVPTAGGASVAFVVSADFK